jgi:hypothetical protein
LELFVKDQEKVHGFAVDVMADPLSLLCLRGSVRGWETAKISRSPVYSKLLLEGGVAIGNWGGFGDGGLERGV